MKLDWIQNALNKLSPSEFLFVIGQAEVKYGSGVKIRNVKQNEKGKAVVVELPSQKLGIIKIGG